MRGPVTKILFGILAIGIASVGLNACFKVDQPVCSFVCGPSQACPEDYECRADGYCHLEGSTESCGFSDASVVTDFSGPDLSGLDLTQNPDGNSDGPPADADTPDL